MITDTDKKSPSPLTQKEKRVMEFIESYLQNTDTSPSYQEIKDHFGWASFNSVQKYLTQLQNKGYLHRPQSNQKRAITLLQTSLAMKNFLTDKMNPPPSSHQNTLTLASKIESASSQTHPPSIGALSIPLLGRVAAGLPIEEMEDNEFIEVPASFVSTQKECFSLKVKGSSMRDDGILDGDMIMVQAQNYAKNGDIVIATVNNEATIKRFYLHSQDSPNLQSCQNTSEPLPSKVELRPSNSEMTSFWYSPEEVTIKGIVVGLLRKF